MKISKSILSIVIVTALFAWVSLAFYTPKTPWGLGADSPEYWELSTNVMQHGTLSYVYEFEKAIKPLLTEVGQKTYTSSVLADGSMYTIKRTPVYPYILSLARLLVDAPIAGIAINIPAFAGLCYFVLRIGQLAFKNKLFFYLTILSPIYFTWNGVLSDIFCSFVTAWFIYLIMKRSNLLYVAIIGSLAILTRPNMLLLVLPVITYFTIIKISRKNIIALLIVVLTISGLCIRNGRLSGSYVPTVFTGYNLWASYIGAENYQNSLLKKYFNEIKPGDKYAVWLKEDTVLRLVADELNKGTNLYFAIAKMDKTTTKLVEHYLLQRPVTAIKKMGINVYYYYAWTCFDYPYVMTTFYDAHLNDIYLQQGKGAVFKLLNNFQKIVLKLLTIISYSWKTVLFAASFAVIPVLLKEKDEALNVLYIGFLFGTLITALIDGVCGGDRLRMPYNVLNVLWVILILDYVVGKYVKKT